MVWLWNGEEGGPRRDAGCVAGEGKGGVMP